MATAIIRSPSCQSRHSLCSVERRLNRSKVESFPELSLPHSVHFPASVRIMKLYDHMLLWDRVGALNGHLAGLPRRRQSKTALRKKSVINHVNLNRSAPISSRPRPMALGTGSGQLAWERELAAGRNWIKTLLWLWAFVGLGQWCWGVLVGSLRFGDFVSPLIIERKNYTFSFIYKWPHQLTHKSDLTA